MLKHIRSVVGPQTVVNNCIDAVAWTGLGRGNVLVNDLEVSHFTFVVPLDDYEEVSTNLSGAVTHCQTVNLSPGVRMTIGRQVKSDESRAISWYYGYPLP